VLSDDISSTKKELFPVIFGPHKQGGISKLKKLRKYLESAGYEKTKLVEELDDPLGLSKSLPDNVFFYRKSIYWVEKCQVALFVIFKGIPYGSAIVEMTNLLSTDPSKAKCVSFFVEEGETLDTLVSGIISDHNCSIAYFKTDDDLNKFAKASCLNHLIEDKCSEIDLE